MHCGEQQTLLTAWPKLMRLAGRAHTVANVLGCRGKPHAIPDIDVPELQWSTCPLCLLASPSVQSALHLARISKVAPLTSWPDKYSVWAVAAVTEQTERG